MSRALALLVLVAGCNTEIDLTLTFDPSTVPGTDVDRLSLLHIAVDGIERANHDALVSSPKRSQRIIYLPRATSGRLDFLVGASDPSQPDLGNFAAGTGSVEIESGRSTAFELLLYGPGGPGPVDGGTFEGDLTGFGATDGSDDSSIDTDGGGPLDGPPPDLVVVRHCASPSVYLCDNFDGTVINPQWSVVGDVILDSADSRSTPNSLRARTSNNIGGQFGLVVPDPSVRQQLQTLWLRAYVHQGTTNPQSDTVIFNANDANFNGYAIVVNTAGKLALMKSTAGGNLTLVNTSTVSFSNSTYECFTWEVSAGTHTELRKNDTAIGGLTANGINIGPIVSWGFGNGPQTPPTVGTYSVFFDDVLVDDQPLTCAQ